MENNVTIANFNVTFGKMDEPLLDYFDTIVYPAFVSGIHRFRRVAEKQYDQYYFIDVKIVEPEEEDYILTGKLVKETILEVKSKIENNELVATDEHYPSAPYSVFYIYLKNHRMVLIKNQKGSPDIKNFGVTARFILKNFIKKYNDNIKESNEEKMDFMPFARVEVIGIPMKKDLKDALEKVTKIKKLKLRMYPLNGDLDLNPIVDSLSNDLRKLVGSKTGNVTLNSPESKKGVVELIDASQGVFDASLEVEYADKSTEKISNEKYSGKTTWNYSEEQINDIDSVKESIYSLESIKAVSKGNLKIYKRAKEKVKKIIQSTN